MSDYGSFDDAELPLFSSVNQACVVERTEQPDSDNYSQKKAEILAAIQQDDVSCVDVETRWHRGQAVVGDLRTDGHLIDTIRGVYRYRGFTRDMVRVSKKSIVRNKYYQTAHWREMAKRRKEYDGWKCVQCGATDSLETHHWRYELFNEDLSDLVTLCVVCHEWMHDCVKGSGVHFPGAIPQHIYERIMDGTSDS